MTQFVRATLLLMAWDFEEEGIPANLNLAAWLVNDLDVHRRWSMPSIFD